MTEKKKKKPMTDKEYVEQEGMHCPFCGSNRVEGTGCINADGAGALGPVTCADCEKSWYDCYDLTGYIDRDTGYAEGNT